MNLPVLGIDVAKRTYQVTLLVAGKTVRAQFPNRAQDFARLQAWLRKHQAPQVHACLEATGRYGEDLALDLHAHGHRVSLVNPMQIKAFGRSRLARNKNDALDADLIAEFCRQQQPPAWTPPPPELLEIRELLHHYDTLHEARNQALNRRAAGVKSPVVLAHLQAQLDLLDQQLADLKQQIDDHFDAHPNLHQQRTLYQSIPGVGPLTAAKLVAVDLPRFHNARAAAAYTGLTPRNVSSGTSLRAKAKLSKLGPSHLRRSLYLPAVSAMRHNPLLRTFAQRLARRGKGNLTILAAVMHKLICIAYGIVKSGRPFDPQHALRPQLTA